MPRTKKRIILHLGAHKTGSTTVQATLGTQRDVLARHDIYYLGPYRNRDIRLMNAFTDEHSDLFWNYLKRNGVDRSSADQMLQEYRNGLEETLASVGEGTIFISNEDLSSLHAAELDRLREFFSRYGDLEVVYIYREILSWYSSWVQQVVRSHAPDRPTPFDAALKRIYAMPQRIVACFGRENVRFLKFENITKAGLIDSILSSCDLPSSGEMGIEEIRKNESASAAAVHSVFFLNKILPGRREGFVRRVRKWLLRIPGKKYQVAGLSREDIDHYAQVRQKAERDFGFDLAPPDTLPELSSHR